MTIRVVAASALAGAAILLAGCGGATQTRHAAAEDETVVAQPVAPADLPELPASASEQPEGSFPDPDSDPEVADRSDTRTVAERTPESRRRSTAILSAADRASFEQLAARLGGESGLAVSGLGLGQRVERVGSLRSAAAWSTAKVPVAMAVINAGGQTAAQGDLTAAITASDNAAAERLWASLGSPQAAANAATEQLRAAGDRRTIIESRRLRSGFTAFGQTAWALTDQTRFTAGLACSAAGSQVLELMGEVSSGQRWGLGDAGVPAQLKGGWGPGSQPGASGGYLDRQMGVLTIDGTPLAVTIATRPADGSHETGTRNLSAIARWFASHASSRERPQSPVC